MSKQSLANLDTGLVFRTKINENFTELYSTPIIPEDDPVNAVPAGFVATIVSRPDDYVKNINSSTTVTVVTQPNINVQATGTITVTGTPNVLTFATGSIAVTGTPVAEETFVVGAQTFTFKAVRAVAGEVTIDADNTTQAGNIVLAITTDLATVTASSTEGNVSLAAATAGAAGNSLALTEAATGIAVSGAGFLTGGLDADTLVVFDQTFTFKIARAVTGDITVDADNTQQAANIVTAITADVAEVTATNLLGVVSLVAVEEAPRIGDGGNSIILTESATGIAVSGAGTFTGGVNADTITVDTATYTFIVNGATPGVGEIALGANVDATATAIAAKLVAIPIITATPSTNTVIITAVADGVAGDGIAVLVDGVRLTGGPATAGGQDEVIAYIEINDINYIFSDVAGDDPTVEYPTAVKVATAAGATTTQIAAAWVVALKLDASVFSATSVSNTDNIVTGNHKDGGVTGTEVTYTNHLVTAGDITVTGVVGGTFSGDVDGTPGYKGQQYWNGTDLYICAATDLTTANDNWKKVTLLTY